MSDVVSRVDTLMHEKKLNFRDTSDSELELSNDSSHPHSHQNDNSDSGSASDKQPRKAVIQEEK